MFNVQPSSFYSSYLPLMPTIPHSCETPQQRTERKKQEREAQIISDNIYEGTKKDRLALTKQKNVVRVFLLGQSESGEISISFTQHSHNIHTIPPHPGKSTTLKSPSFCSSPSFYNSPRPSHTDFHMKHTKSVWKKERTSWRVVIQLNLLRSIIRILDALRAEMHSEIPDTSSTLEGEEEDRSDDHHRKSSLVFSDKHRLLILRLAPLREVDLDLKRLLGAGSEEVRPSSGFTNPAPSDIDPPTPSKRASGSRRTWRRTDEFHVRSKRGSTAADPTTEVIARCKDDMKALWEDSVVRSVLSRRKIRLEDSAGLFVSISIFTLFRFLITLQFP